MMSSRLSWQIYTVDPHHSVNTTFGSIRDFIAHLSRNERIWRHIGMTTSYLPAQCHPCRLAESPFLFFICSDRAISMKEFLYKAVSFSQWNIQTFLLPDITNTPLDSISSTSLSFFPNTAIMQIKFIALGLLFAVTQVIASDPARMHPLSAFPLVQSQIEGAIIIPASSC